MDDLIAVAPPRNEALNELRGDLDAAATHTDNDTDPQAAPSFPWASILAHTDDTFIPHRTCACTVLHSRIAHAHHTNNLRRHRGIGTPPRPPNQTLVKTNRHLSSPNVWELSLNP